MDVFLLPNIDITTDPRFPLCKNSSDLLKVKAKCEIDSGNESYSVTWDKENIKAEVREKQALGKFIFLRSSSLPVHLSESLCKLVMKIHDMHV